MPRMNNTFMAMTPIGEALKNYTNAYFSGPTAAKQQATAAQAAYSRALTEKAVLDAEAKRGEMQARSGVADIFSRFPAAQAAQTAPVADPGVSGPARALAATSADETRGAGADFMSNAPANIAALATRAGMKGDDIANMFRFYMANSGASDADTVRALVGSGKTLGVNDAVSLGHQSDIAGRNAANDLREATTVQGMRNEGDLAVQRARDDGLMARIEPQATADIRIANNSPLTESQVKGDILSRYSPEDQRIAVLGQPAYGANKTQVEGGILQGLPAEDQRVTTMGDALSPVKVVDPTSGSGARYVTKSDSIGMPAPMPNSASAADAGIKKTAAQVLESDRNIRRSRSLSQMARQAGSDPRNFGFSGFLRNTTQDAIQQGDAVASLFGQKGQEIKSEIISSGYDIDPMFFDPSIPQKDFIINVLAYDLAKTIAEQSGHSLSDKDFRVWRGNLAGSGPLNNQADFYARLDMVDNILNEMSATNRETEKTLGVGYGQAVTPQSTQTAGPGRVIRYDASGNRIQ